jgi:hypothetical protein
MTSVAISPPDPWLACHGGVTGHDQAAVGRGDRVDHLVAFTPDSKGLELRLDANALGPGPAVVEHAEEYITEGGV